MHEYPVTTEIIRIASGAAEKQNASKVTKIALVVGDLSGYASDSIQMYFDEISRGTPCEGASLEIKRIRPQLKCAECGLLFDMTPLSFKCPACGGGSRPAGNGSEFYIDYIEAE